MSSTGVSPAQGHGSIASPSVKTAPAHSVHRSRPVLFSQFRGPFALNMAETDEERKAREDEEKRTNFDKVREKAEREEKARKEAEARAEEAERKLKERQEADKKAEEAKLAEEGKLKELADAKSKEAQEKADEAAREKARADAAEAKAKEYEDAQEEELKQLIETIPVDKRPELDSSDPVAKRLKQVKHVLSILGTGPKPGVGNTPKKADQEKADRKQELLNKGMNRLSEDEALELAELMNETA